MGKLLIIGAGGVGSVNAHKAAQMPEVFSNITVASRSMARPERIQREIRERYGKNIEVEQVDADRAENVAQLIRKVRPDVVIHDALGYQNFPIMNACLETRVHYIDTAGPEVKDVPGFSYEWQWAMHSDFEKAGIMGLLGFGFDPGVTSVWFEYLKKHHFNNDKSNIRQLDILDCNAGNHGKQFATNFDPDINLREITLPPRHYVRRPDWIGWISTPPITDKNAIHYTFDFPVAGKQEAYLLYHEELESLAHHYPHMEKARFWMTFGEKYLKHLRAFVKYGLNSSKSLEFESNKVSPKEMIARIAPEIYQDKETAEMFRTLGLLDDEKKEFSSRNIRPVELLASVLPKPDSLAPNYTGKTSICTYLRGKVNGKEKKVLIYNSCDHAECVRETGQHGISYTAGVPPVIAAEMIIRGYWKGAGVFNPEQLDPDPYINSLNRHGLPSVVEDPCTRKLLDD